MSETEVDLENPLVSLEWSDYTTLPVGMQHAQAVVVGDKAYVGGGMTTDPEMETNIYVFDHTIESPTVTPIPTPGPTRWSTLATINSRLVLAGGARDRTNATDELWALQDDGNTWDQPFPPMPHACWGAAALSTNDHLILAGGVENDPSTPLKTVQIYNVNSRQWALAQPLPKSYYFMKGVLHNDDWYLAGGRWQYESIYYTSLESLITMSDERKENIWKTLPNLSRRQLCCSCVSIYLDQLIAIGGTIITSPTDEIQKYSFNNQRWVDAGRLDQPRDSVCTVILPSKELLLIGGNLEGTCHRFSDSVSKTSIKVFHSLTNNFTQPALAKIEIVAGIHIFHSLVCGEMDANAAELLSDSREDTTGQLQLQQKTADGSSRDSIRKWLDGKSESTLPPTWEVLLRLFRDMRMYDVADGIERLFTDNKSASVGAQLQPVMMEQPRGIEAESTIQPAKLLLAKPEERGLSLHTYPEDHQTFVISSHGDLRGAEIIGETCCHISGEKPLTYEWKGYGITIQIPKGALPSDVTSAELRIRASLAGQYEFPEDHELVSGIFWISFPHQFLQSAMLDIQHCLALTHPSQCSSLSFVVAKCTQKGLPYRFKLLEGGVFTPHNSYGSISISRFSGLGIVTTNRGDPHVSPEKQYSAQLYYLPKGINKWLLLFLIIQDLDICNTFIQQKYTEMNAEPGPYQRVFFESNEITLDISEDGAVSGGWSLLPLMHPGLTREHIDKYKPGKQIPSCQIQLKWTGKEEPEELLLRVQLIGAKRPNDFFRITRDPVCEGSEVPSLPATPIRPDLNDLADVSNYLLPLGTEDIFRLGLVLGLSVATLQPLMESQTFLHSMLIAWLQGKDDVGKKGGHTWRALVVGLKEPLLRQTQIAETIERERCT